MSFIEIIPRTSLKNIWDSTVTPLIYLSTPMLEPVWPRVLLLMSPPQVWGPTPAFQLSLGSWSCHSSLPLFTQIYPGYILLLCRLKPLLLMEALYPKGSALPSEQPPLFLKDCPGTGTTWNELEYPFFSKLSFLRRWNCKVWWLKKKTIQLLRKLHTKGNHIQVKEKCWKCDKVK